jgi:hypothetical protein
VRAIIRPVIRLLEPDHIISGRCPYGGVDSWAEELAAELGYFPGLTREAGFWPFPATVHRWNGPGGFKQRDQAMAEACTHLLAVRSAYSRTFGSGWTAETGRRLGRVVATEVI